jgi:hypothetical protein
MDIEKIKNMDKAKVLYELSRLQNMTAKQTRKTKEKKKPDYNIFEKPKSDKVEDFFSKEFLLELHDYLDDNRAKQALKKYIKKKNDSDSSSSDSD